MLHRLVAFHRGVVYALLLLVIGGGVVSREARAQREIRIEADETPLDTVLRRLRAQSGIDLVYAERLVRGRTASCTYIGTDPRAALRCVLTDTELSANRVRRRQFVLRASDDGASRSSRETVSGYVADAETGERLSGAHVYLPDLQAGTTTNRDGYFVLSSLPSGTYDVRISYLGYRAVDTTLATSGEARRIALTSASIESEEVVVEAGGTTAEQEARVPGMSSVDLARLDQLPSLTEPDLFRALQWTPGVRKTSTLSGGLSVRGADPDQNLYLLDGAPVYHPWHAFSLVSTFQTGTLKNTNLYRGGFPVAYGGRLSSVVDAQMKDGSRNQPSAEVGVGMLSGRFRVEAPISDNTSFMVSGRRSYIDKIIGQTHSVTDESGRQDTLRTGYYFYDVSAKVSHRLNEDNRLTVSYYQGRDALDLRLPFDLSLDFDSWLRPADLFFEIKQSWQNRVVSARHQYLVGDDIFVTTSGYYSGYQAQEVSFVQPTTTASLASDYGVRLHDGGVKVDVTYHRSLSHELSGGLKVSTLQFTSTLDSKVRRSADVIERRRQDSDLGSVQVSGYLQETWTPTPTWSVQPGVRASYFSSGDYFRVAPRLSARYTVDPKWLTLRANAGVHVQYLHRIRDRESLAYDLVSSRWVPASERVQPATGLQLGLEARTHPTDGLTLELDSYLRGTRNLLAPADAFQEKDGIEGSGIEVGALLGQYTEGEERAFGTELNATYQREAWMARLSLGTSRTSVRAPGRVQSGPRWRPSDLDIPVTLRGALGWTGRSWQAALAAEWRSGRPVSAPASRFQVGDPVESSPTTYLHRPRVNNERLSPYFRLDLSVGYAFRMLSARWQASVNFFNVTNRVNERGRTYAPTSTGVDVSSQRGLPLLPLLELEMKL